MDIALASFLNPSGLSTVGQDYFRCFSKAGIRTIPIWIGPPEMPEALDKDIADEMISASQRPLEDNPLQFHAGRADEVRALKRKSALVGSIVLEGNRLIDDHIRICRGLDAVLSPTYFCRNVCLASGIPKNKIFYFPYALNSEKWHPEVKPVAQKTGVFRFLFMNAWYERKGWDLMLRAYWEEFSKDDPVQLVVKSYREDDRQTPLDIYIAMEADKLRIDRSRRAPVLVYDQVMAAPEIPGFMKSFDAFVSPHRSEGFGLNIWHAMAVGTPVIATNYGGNCDFTKSDTSWLVDVAEMVRPGEKEVELFPYYKNTTWALPDVASLRRQMRDCMRNPVEAEKRAKRGSDLVAKLYGHGRVMSHLEEILKQACPGVWEKLAINKSIEMLAKQPSERFESIDKPLRMIEI